MSFCGECGKATRDAPARTMRHSGVCTCLFCEECGAVTGDEMENRDYNAHTKRVHDSLNHPNNVGAKA